MTGSATAAGHAAVMNGIIAMVTVNHDMDAFRVVQRPILTKLIDAGPWQHVNSSTARIPLLVSAHLVIHIASVTEIDDGTIAMAAWTGVPHPARQARTIEIVETEKTSESGFIAHVATPAEAEMSSTMAMIRRAWLAATGDEGVKATAKALLVQTVEALSDLAANGETRGNETGRAVPLMLNQRSKSLHLSLPGCTRVARRVRLRRIEICKVSLPLIVGYPVSSRGAAVWPWNLSIELQGVPTSKVWGESSNQGMYVPHYLVL